VLSGRSQVYYYMCPAIKNLWQFFGQPSHW